MMIEVGNPKPCTIPGRLLGAVMAGSSLVGIFRKSD
jgi:hypothetical protein